MGWKAIATGAGACWALLVAFGNTLPDRIFFILLGATMVVTTYVALRGPAMWESYRTGRIVERELRRRRREDGDTVDLARMQIQPPR